MTKGTFKLFDINKINAYIDSEYTCLAGQGALALALAIC